MSVLQDVKAQLASLSRAAEELADLLADLPAEDRASLVEDLCSEMPRGYAKVSLDPDIWREIALGWKIFGGMVEDKAEADGISAFGNCDRCGEGLLSTENVLCYSCTTVPSN